jgi:hypothetical protein
MVVFLITHPEVRFVIGINSVIVFVLFLVPLFVIPILFVIVPDFALDLIVVRTIRKQTTHVSSYPVRSYEP